MKNIEKEISSELDVKVELEGASVIIRAEYDGKMGGAGLYVKTDLAKLVDKITDLIPGEWDDAMIDPLVEKLLKKKSE
jgi:hypothetical protein